MNALVLQRIKFKKNQKEAIHFRKPLIVRKRVCTVTFTKELIRTSPILSTSPRHVILDIQTKLLTIQIQYCSVHVLALKCSQDPNTRLEILNVW
jgi:hypothetical protein